MDEVLLLRSSLLTVDALDCCLGGVLIGLGFDRGTWAASLMSFAVYGCLDGGLSGDDGLSVVQSKELSGPTLLNKWRGTSRLVSTRYSLSSYFTHFQPFQTSSVSPATRSSSTIIPSGPVISACSPCSTLSRPRDSVVISRTLFTWSGAPCSVLAIVLCMSAAGTSESLCGSEPGTIRHAKHTIDTNLCYLWSGKYDLVLSALTHHSLRLGRLVGCLRVPLKN